MTEHARKALQEKREKGVRCRTCNQFQFPGSDIDPAYMRIFTWRTNICRLITGTESKNKITDSSE